MTAPLVLLDRDVWAGIDHDHSFVRLTLEGVGLEAPKVERYLSPGAAQRLANCLMAASQGADWERPVMRIEVDREVVKGWVTDTLTKRLVDMSDQQFQEALVTAVRSAEHIRELNKRP